MILDNRTAHRESILLLLELGEIWLAAGEVLVAGVAVSSTMELVGSGLGDGVDQHAAEISLADVERRQQNLILLHRIERNRLGVGLRAWLAGGAESEEIAGSCAIDLDRVLADIHAAAREADAGRRRDLRY